MNDIDRSLLEPSGEKRLLVEPEAKRLLEGWGVPTVRCRVASTSEEAASLARSIGYPVALKILSRDIVHKTEAGGVRLGLRSAKEVRLAFEEIVTNARDRAPGAGILGVTVQRMVQGIEVAMGVARDPQFGHVLMFGAGGVWIELLEDIVFRLIPIDIVDADEMIRDTRAFSLLQGRRGSGGDLEGLARMLTRVSDLVVAHPAIEEMDLNPVITSPSGSVVADARIVVGGSSQQAPAPQPDRGGLVRRASP